jgi:hypothetical protein
MATESKFRWVRNPVTLFGIWLTTVSAVLFLIVFLLDLLGFYSNPYLGIVFYLLLPGFFVLGLALMPVGVYIARRREGQGRPPGEWVWPVVDLNRPSHRYVALVLLTATLANIVVISLAGYRGIEYMDSVEFCGRVCHTVMRPEFTAYQNGPHARVECVQCHIGPGAPWFVRSKLSGTRQLFAVAFHTYPCPIPSPVVNLRPARETCEQCHWPEKFTGDRIRVVREYADDEANSETTTSVQLHVGSGSESLGAHGIHWHMAPSTRVSYKATDFQRQNIVWVRVEDHAGTREFRAEGVTDDQLAKISVRRMDCMDCHNRPSHRFDSTPERAVDDAVANGLIPRTLPFARREAVAALKASYSSQSVASAAIARRLHDFYQLEPAPDAVARKAEIARTIATVQAIYRRNLFPDMKVTWGTYPNNLGHVDFPGCFRCHDDAHKAGDGRVIKQDCELCHRME